jgi:hypothetical protein
VTAGTAIGAAWPVRLALRSHIRSTGTRRYCNKKRYPVTKRSMSVLEKLDMSRWDFLDRPNRREPLADIRDDLYRQPTPSRLGTNGGNRPPAMGRRLSILGLARPTSQLHAPQPPAFRTSVKPFRAAARPPHPQPALDGGRLNRTMAPSGPGRPSSRHSSTGLVPDVWMCKAAMGRKR